MLLALVFGDNADLCRECSLLGIEWPSSTAITTKIEKPK